MAGGKLSPRQKMIGMMYLVLTALLALQVSKDILKAFVVVNDGLENTEKTFDKDAGQLYAKFDEKKTIDPLRVMENWKKAQEARKLSESLGAYIGELKKRLIRETEGFSNKEEDTIRLAYVSKQEDYDISTHILIGDSEDGSKGEARTLKTKLIDFKAKMLALLPEEDRKQITFTIDTEEPVNGEEDERTWEMRNFYHTPLAASVTILSKIQADVKSAEVVVIDALLKNVDADVIPFDTVAARVIAQSNYVLLGEEYNADIFLAAFNKTLKPRVTVGQDSLAVDHGIGRYKVPASSEGIKTYEGVINMKTPKGKVLTFPFKSEYIVAKPSLNVSADKMNAMYAGVDNPITVSVPGVPTEMIKVSLSNGELVTTGKGKFTVRNPRIGTTDVNVVATMPNGETRSMGKLTFRVKQLPDPFVTCGGSSGGRKTTAEMAILPGLIPKYQPDFPFEAQPKLKSYQISFITGNGIVETLPPSSSPGFDQRVKDKLGKLKKGNVVLIEEIKVEGPDKRVVSVPPISFTVK